MDGFKSPLKPSKPTGGVELVEALLKYLSYFVSPIRVALLTALLTAHNNNKSRWQNPKYEKPTKETRKKVLCVFSDFSVKAFQGKAIFSCYQCRVHIKELTGRVYTDSHLRQSGIVRIPSPSEKSS